MDWKVMDQPRVLEGGGEGEGDVDGDGGRDGQRGVVGRRDRRRVRCQGGGDRLLQGDGRGGGGGVGGEGEEGGGHPGLRFNDGLLSRPTHLSSGKLV